MSKKTSGHIWLAAFLYITPLLMSTALITVGAFLFAKNLRFLRKGIETEAIITSVVITYDDEDNASHTVYVSYTADGTEYSNKRLNTYVLGMRKGQTIRILYLPDDPGKMVYAEVSMVAPIILTSTGGTIFLVVALVAGTRVYKKKKHVRLKETGRAVQAVITDIIVNYNMSVNGSHPVKLFCTDSEGYFYKSRNIYEPDSLFAVNDPIWIYVNGKNDKKYSIDVKSYLADKKNPGLPLNLLDDKNAGGSGR